MTLWPSPAHFRYSHSCRLGAAWNAAEISNQSSVFQYVVITLRSPIYVILYGSTQYTDTVRITVALYYFILKTTESAALHVVVECRHIDAWA